MREFFEEDKKEKKVDEKEKGGNRRWKQKEDRRGEEGTGVYQVDFRARATHWPGKKKCPKVTGSECIDAGH